MSLAASGRRQLREADKRLFRFGKSFELLNELNWSSETKVRFLERWKAKSPELPRVELERLRYEAEKRELKEILSLVQGKDPVSGLLRKSVQSYRDSLAMLENVGKKRFTALSEYLYGSTLVRRDDTAKAVIKAAKGFLKANRYFREESIIPPDSVCILPKTVVKEIAKAAKRYMPEHDVRVRTKRKMAAKAAASVSTVSVRSATCFAQHDIKQLIQHELLVHTLTLANGRAQPYRFFGLSVPRTTCTQEGLAVFSEFITNAIDVSRLARLSARVLAVDMALQGADFIEVFRFFRKQGQSLDESYHSSQRIFRGGQVRGGVVFTKDLVYLKGLIQLHRFFLDCFRQENYLYPVHLFAGRFALEDIPLIEPLFESGELLEPKYKPPWLENRSTLLGFLLSSSVLSQALRG